MYVFSGYKPNEMHTFTQGDTVIQENRVGVFTVKQVLVGQCGLVLGRNGDMSHPASAHLCTPISKDDVPIYHRHKAWKLPFEPSKLPVYRRYTRYYNRGLLTQNEYAVLSALSRR